MKLVEAIGSHEQRGKALGFCLIFCFFSQLSYANTNLRRNVKIGCDFSDLQNPLKTLAETFKKSEQLSLGEKVLPQKDKAVEFIQRSKTKNWKGFDWKLRPLEFAAATMAQEKYIERCSPKNEIPLFESLINDYQMDRIASKDRKRVMRIFMLLLPCLETEEQNKVQALSSDFFFNFTEEYVSVVISTESEVPTFAPDYKACSNRVIKEHQITDSLLAGVESSLRKNGYQQSLTLRLKGIRNNKLHFKTGKYLLNKIDQLIANSAQEKQ